MYVQAPPEAPPRGRDTDRVPQIGITDALRREWPTAVAPIVALLLLALFVGLVRAPEYTAESRLAVGRVDLRQAGALQGYVTATQSLAGSYSRAITAEAVTSAVGERLGISPEEVAVRISATPIPESSVFRITAKADSPADAERLANVASAELIKYVNALNAPDPSPEQLLRQYEATSLDYNEKLSASERAQEDFNRRESGGTEATLQRAEADQQAAKLRRDSLQTRYRLTQQSQSSVAEPRVLSPAAGAFSDRLSRLQLLVFIALVAGGAAGLALALLRGNRQLRRDLLA